jgi:hypothetical protein
MERACAEARLAGLGIGIVEELRLPRHAAVRRGEFVALVERGADGEYGRAGSAGWMSEHGFATLVWRHGEGWFVARGWERAATAAEVEALRAFARDLDQALRPAQ